MAQITIIDEAGVEASAEYDPVNTVISARLSDGRVVTFSPDLMVEKDGRYHAEMSFDRYAAHDAPRVMVIPIIEEQLRVEKRTVVAQKLRLSKHVHTEEETVAIPLESERLHVERVPFNRVVEQPQGIRREADRLIIPIHEERLVVVKQTVLVEELHVVSEKQVVESAETYTLRREELTIKEIGDTNEMGV